LRRKNPRDRAREEAFIANRGLAILLYDALMSLAKYEAGGKKVVMEAITYMVQIDEEYPPELQQIGEMLTDWGIEYLTGMFKEGGEMLSVLELEEIALAAVYRREQP
jgi:hypothetical protein